MKLVHKNEKLVNHVFTSVTDQLKEAKKLEEEKTAEAIEIYENVIKKEPLKEAAYHRLMIVLRKEKKYKKELDIINTAIRKFQEFYKSAFKLKYSAKVKKLSQTISKSVGLSDKLGNSIYQPGPIAAWQRRKKTVEKIIIKKAKI
jgi:tetratricopeptide (TPR) repeat protein